MTALRSLISSLLIHSTQRARNRLSSYLLAKSSCVLQIWHKEVVTKMCLTDIQDLAQLQIQLMPFARWVFNKWLKIGYSQWIHRRNEIKLTCCHVQDQAGRPGRVKATFFIISSVWLTFFQWHNFQVVAHLPRLANTTLDARMRLTTFMWAMQYVWLY